MFLTIKTIMQIALLSSIMVLVILGLRTVLGRKLNQRVFVMLWALVLFRMILPVTIQSPVNVIRLFPAQEKAVVLSAPADLETEEIMAPESVHDISAGAENEIIPQAEAVAAEMSDRTAEAPLNAYTGITAILKSLSIWQIVFWVWAAGALTAAIISIVRLVSFQKRIRSIRFISNSLVAKKVYTDCHRLGIRRSVAVFESDYIDSPITCGLLKPKIILPTLMTKRIGKHKTELIIFHELIHIKNNDMLKNYIWLLAKIIYWFNPMVYIGYLKYQEDIELLCDDIVRQKHSKEDMLQYIQGILDMVKYTQGEFAVPAFVPFSQHKTKVRKRVEIMLKPTKKKATATVLVCVIALMLIIGCFTTACMKQEQDNDMQAPEKAILVSEDTAVEKEADSPEEKAERTGAEIINAFDYWDNDDETVTVDIDAEVYMPKISSFPIAVLDEQEITPELVERLTNVMFGDVPVFQYGVMTKAMYESAIERVNESATDMNSDMADASGAKNLDELRKVADIQIEKIKKAMVNAPDEVPLADFDDVNSSMGFVGSVETGEDYPGIIAAQTSDSSFRQVLLKNYEGNEKEFDPIESTPLDIDSQDEMFLAARKVAEDFIKQAGIQGVRLDKAYLLEDAIWYTASDNAPREQIGSDGYFHIFAFERVIGDGTVSFTFSHGEFAEPFEKILVWVKDNELKQFKWLAPMKLDRITEELNDLNINYTEAIEVFKEQAGETYLDEFDFFDHADVKVNRIVFELVMYKEKSTGTFRVVPAWTFYGQVLCRATERYANDNGLKAGEYFDATSRWVTADTLMCINAVDGSVIWLDNRG